MNEIVLLICGTMAAVSVGGIGLNLLAIAMGKVRV
jgi:hypothetical protein